VFYYNIFGKYKVQAELIGHVYKGVLLSDIFNAHGRTNLIFINGNVLLPNQFLIQISDHRWYHTADHASIILHSSHVVVKSVKTL